MSPAIAALSINDGQASPVAHSFDPVTTDGSLAKWADRSPSIPSGYRLISFEVVPPSGNRTTWKVTAGFTNPTVATVDGVDTVVRYSSAQVVLNIHPDSLLQERKDLLAYVANFLDHATIKTSVNNLEPVY
jgi:hypothetical protein